MRPRAQAELQRETDQRRGSARDRGYTAQWDKASKLFRLAHPLCLGCEAVGRTELATCTDHIVPHQGDATLFWDHDNWQPACDWHHSQIKQALEALWRKDEIGADELRLDSATARRLTMTRTITIG